MSPTKVSTSFVFQSSTVLSWQGESRKIHSPDPSALLLIFRMEGSVIVLSLEEHLRSYCKTESGIITVKKNVTYVVIHHSSQKPLHSVYHGQAAT
jgi:hypothetical protein